jgi:hypothetical protein
MTQDIAFDEPVIVQISSQPVRTVDQAAEIVRSHLRTQFTMQRLTTLLVLERAADGLEVAEARQAFCSWASNELPMRRPV